MATNFDDEIAAQKKKIENVEKEIEDGVKPKIKQVEAALEGRREGAGLYAGRGNEFLEGRLLAIGNQLAGLQTDLAELRKKENLLLEKQGTKSKKIKLRNEETERVEVWTVKGQAQFDARFLRSNMDLFSKENDAVVDDFDKVEAATPAELKDPESYRYVARPTVGRSKLQYANEMAHNVAATLETHVGKWMVAQGLHHSFDLGIYHDKYNPYNVYLKSDAWANPKKNVTGEREFDFLFTLDNVVCLGSVKMKFTIDYMADLQADLDVLRTDLSQVSIKLDRARDGASHISITDVLSSPLSSAVVVGIAVTALPNADLKPSNDIIVVESRGEFSVATFEGKAHPPPAVVDAVRQSAEKQRRHQIIPIGAS